MEHSQQTKAEVFKALHTGNEILLLPNIWDPLGAALLEDLGYPAIATASASVAFTHGYDDGEIIPFDDLLSTLSRVVKSVRLPVTADIESGYATSEKELQSNIERLLETGIVGINLEDSDKESNSLYPLQQQCDRINAVREAAIKNNVNLFINARTDVYLKAKQSVAPEEKLAETTKRGQAYLSAGADCIFPPGLVNEADIAALVNTLRCPINIFALPGIPDLNCLKELKVARLSIGPGFLKIAVRAMKEAALKLKKGEGLAEIIHNDVSSQYLKKLIMAK